MHNFYLHSNFYIYTLAVRNNIIMTIQSVKNPANPAGVTVKGKSTLIMLFRSLRVGLFISLKNAKQRRKREREIQFNFPNARW